jgi:SAM-dependent methyltransferase
MLAAPEPASFSPYDLIAPIYDGLWQTAEAAAENRAVIRALGYTGGPLLDIGCGSGLLLDYLTPDRYVGVDPSRAMLARLTARFPGATVHCSPFEAYRTAERFACVVALFGAASYVTPEALNGLWRLLEPAGRYFLMFYRPGYRPHTHEAAGFSPPYYAPERCTLPGTWWDLGNYRVLSR